MTTTLLKVSLQVHRIYVWRLRNLSHVSLLFGPCNPVGSKWPTSNSANCKQLLEGKMVADTSDTYGCQSIQNVHIIRSHETDTNCRPSTQNRQNRHWSDMWRTVVRPRKTDPENADHHWPDNSLPTYLVLCRCDVLNSQYYIIFRVVVAAVRSNAAWVLVWRLSTQVLESEFDYCVAVHTTVNLRYLGVSSCGVNKFPRF